MKLHGRSDVLLPSKTFIRPAEKHVIPNEASWSFRRSSPLENFYSPD